MRGLHKYRGIIVRPVQILRGYKNIALALRTSEKQVRDMVQDGAPIVFDGETPKADAAEVWAWYADWLTQKP